MIDSEVRKNALKSFLQNDICKKVLNCTTYKHPYYVEDSGMFYIGDFVEEGYFNRTNETKLNLNEFNQFVEVYTKGTIKFQYMVFNGKIVMF